VRSPSRERPASDARRGGRITVDDFTPAREPASVRGGVRVSVTGGSLAGAMACTTALAR
jgi:hypothetical protein